MNKKEILLALQTFHQIKVLKNFISARRNQYNPKTFKKYMKLLNKLERVSI